MAPGMKGSGTPQLRALPQRTQLMLIAGLGVVLAGALLIAHFAHRQPAPETETPPPAGVFQATKEERADILIAPARLLTFSSQVVTDGKVAANDDRTTQIFAPFTGRIAKVLVTTGQTVRRGQTLATFAANEVVQAQSDLTTSRAAQKQAEAQLSQAQSNFERQRALYQGDAAAQRDFEQARTDLAAAEQAAATARAATAAAAGRLDVLNLTPRLGALAKGAESGRFSPEAPLTSPIDGVVTFRQAGPGEFVNSVAGGATQPLLTISDLKTVWLTANLRDSDATQVRLGARMTARLTAFPGEVFTGRITSVAGTVDPNTHRVLVRADIDNPKGRLRPEMFAEMTIDTGPPRTSLGVPQSAIVYDGPIARVWLSRPNGVFALRQVALGRSQGGIVEILSGLQQNDRVAVSGALFIDEAGKAGE